MVALVKTKQKQKQMKKVTDKINSITITFKTITQLLFIKILEIINTFLQVFPNSRILSIS